MISESTLMTPITEFVNSCSLLLDVSPSSVHRYGRGEGLRPGSSSDCKEEPVGLASTEEGGFGENVTHLPPLLSTLTSQSPKSCILHFCETSLASRAPHPSWPLPGCPAHCSHSSPRVATSRTGVLGSRAPSLCCSISASGSVLYSAAAQCCFKPCSALISQPKKKKKNFCGQISLGNTALDIPFL